MSDSVEDIVRGYKENVCKEHEHPRSIGLFTIPEYPELEAEGGMWSSALDTILTTLRYLAPATLITIFWGQQSFLFRILKYIDSAFRSIVFSSEEQKQAVLQWLAETGPVKVEHLDTVWRHGWILCGVLDAALPGACAGHPPTRHSIKHAQAIADHYLGVEPVFSRQELESNDSLSKHQEWRFATYLDRIRQALSKITPAVSKPASQRTSPETNQFILDYVAKGCGLSAIQINNKAHFKVYPTAQQSLDPGDITILIRGPKDTYGMVVIPPILGKAQMIRHKLLGLQSKQNYTENALPLTQGATYMRNYGKNDMNKTYYIPKIQYDIDIDVDSRTEHIKISYTVKLEGKYLVSITSRGQSIVGSPFSVTATNDIISVLEKDNFCLEDGEEIDIVDVKTDRKIVLRIVDFVTEKMLLKENGTLEKISDDDAKVLMMTDNYSEIDNFSSDISTKIISNISDNLAKRKFYKIARTFITMHRVCKVFHDLIIQKQLNLKEKTDICLPSKTQQGIPDIINSTLTEAKGISYVQSDKREKFIVPESISVSLRSEISKTHYDEIVDNVPSDADNVSINTPIIISTDFAPDSLEITNCSNDYLDGNISGHNNTISTTVNNPFLNEMFEENHVATNKYGTFVASEYENNNSQSEETRNSSITITVHQDPNTDHNQDQLTNNNPFIDTNVDLERPKTPVFKIISGHKLNRGESVYINPKSELDTDEELCNEFINPFFMHQLESRYVDQAPITDFIIGAPVSLPPLIRAPSPEPKMTSLKLNENENLQCKENKGNDSQQEHISGAVRDAIYLTPLQDSTSTLNQTTKDNSAFAYTSHSLDSSLTDTIDNCNTSTASDSQFEHDHSDSDRNVTPRRDTWDSAYVSIDENNSSPDSNNNENTTISESLSKQKFYLSDESTGLNQDDISNMGPAEREIWQTCNELKCDINKPQDDVRPNKWEPRRPIFTPIMEESDKSISLGTKDVLKMGLTTSLKETDTVSVAFAELDDMYQEMYFPNSEINSATPADDKNKLYSTEFQNIKQIKETSVDSASETTDVKRHNAELEGTISEVQVNAAESVSVSQTLRDKHDHVMYKTGNKVKTEFGETRCSNLVLEKKKFWDDRIREIEANSELTAVIPKKRRVYSKPLKHDSLSKRKGKQMIKNFLSVGDYSQVKDVHLDSDKVTLKKNDEPEPNQMESLQMNQKLVEKWKKFWDDKLEVDQMQTESEIRQKSPKCKTPVRVTQSTKIENEPVDTPKDIAMQDTKEVSSGVSKHHHEAAKHELSEEVFRAFETSPKRFFGTSRKQIMHKIDTFLGKPAEINTSTADLTTCHDSGLVSSRISLFHNLSNTEELPWSRRKCQSLHNISQKKESENSSSYIEDFPKLDKTKNIKPGPISSESKISNIKTCSNESMKLKAKRATMMKNANNKSFDEIDSEPPLQQENTVVEKKYIKKIIADAPSKHKFMSPKVEVLRKKSFSKSETDIFNKRPSDAKDTLDKYQSCDELPQINVKNFISLYESVSKTAEMSKPKRVCRTSSADSEKTLFNRMNSNAVNKNNYVAEQASISNHELNPTMPRETSTNLWTSKTSATVSNLSLDTKTSDSYDVEDLTNDNKETMYLSLSDIELEIIESSPEKSCESTPEKTIEPAHIAYKNRFKLVKEYFQSLEELREIKKPRKLNECELLLRKQSTESLENDRPQQRIKKNIKSRSLSSSEIAKGWQQMQERQVRCVSEENSNSKLVKISEKFNVDDLYIDVTEGKLSRQGSLRGIPHKKAVLEAFRSMENVADIPMSTYEITDHLTDFDKHTVKNTPTYLKEYPYLPTTDPSKCHSRVDIKASGLISLKELKQQKQRRNSVPDV